MFLIVSIQQTYQIYQTKYKHDVIAQDIGRLIIQPLVNYIKNRRKLKQLQWQKESEFTTFTDKYNINKKNEHIGSFLRNEGACLCTKQTLHKSYC